MTGSISTSAPGLSADRFVTLRDNYKYLNDSPRLSDSVNRSVSLRLSVDPSVGRGLALVSVETCWPARLPVSVTLRCWYS